jgi:simple sugar transport system ATP-binding protein
MTAVEARDIVKTFGPTRALRGVDLSLEPGRALGLVGRNGAGKSTLISILSGLIKADQGTVRFDGVPAPPAGAVHAWREKIATVHQHSMLIPDLTVAENVFLGRPNQGRLVDWRAMRREARQVLAEWGFEIDASVACRELTVEQRQIVEIARAVASGTRCLLLDEPTAALEHDAVRRLFDRVRQLVDSGVAVLYISHHLEEVFDICDDVTVLRDGEVVLNAPTRDLTRDTLITAMVHGNDPQARPDGGDQTGPGGPAAPRARPIAVPAADGADQGGLLEVRDLTARSTRGNLHGVTLSVGAGERVGVVGLVSSGVIALGRIVAGADRAETGRISIGGRDLPNGRRGAALRAGIGYIPEDRRAEGFVGGLSIAENITMTVVDRLSHASGGFLTPRAVTRAADPLAGSLGVVASSLKQPVAELSGGNQQKVTVARALAREPRLIVAITPTRGVDVASKELLLESLRAATVAGAGLLLATDDINDLEVCDRVLVLVRGRITARFDRAQDGAQFDREALISAIEGLTTDDPEVAA